MSRLTADIYVCYSAIEQTLMSVAILEKTKGWDS